jgi:hypothetical protein
MSRPLHTAVRVAAFGPLGRESRAIHRTVREHSIRHIPRIAGMWHAR